MSLQGLQCQLEAAVFLNDPTVGLLEHGLVRAELLVHSDQHLEGLSADLLILTVEATCEGALHFGDVEQFGQLLSLDLQEVDEVFHALFELGVPVDERLIVTFNTLNYRVNEKLVVIGK